MAGLKPTYGRVSCKGGIPNSWTMDTCGPMARQASCSGCSSAMHLVYCIAADRNGYIACHNQKYNHAQRSGDVVWNTANCRNRRIFNDRTGLASARSSKPFLLQT